MVIISAPTHDVANIHQDMSVRYSKVCNQLLNANQARGIEMKHERTTTTTKSLESSCHKCATEAPCTFLIPISLVRCSAMYDAMPNRPRQEMTTARVEKKVARVPIRFSLPNFLANSA